MRIRGFNLVEVTCCIVILGCLAGSMGTHHVKAVAVDTHDHLMCAHNNIAVKVTVISSVTP